MTTMIEGDEYTSLLATWRPVGINDDHAKYLVFDVIQRLVDDARRYRTRALVAEDECTRLNRTIADHELLTDHIVQAIRCGRPNGL